MEFKDENAQATKMDELYKREVQEHYSSLINRIPIGVYLFVSSPDGSMRFDFVSPKFCEFFNIEKERLLADPSLAFSAAHPDDYESLIAANKYATENGQVFYWEGRFVINGQEKWVEINSEPNRLSNGDILWSGLIKETTERKLAEKKILAERAQAQQYLDIAAVMIVALDINGNITLINRQGCKILGYSEAEVMGKNWFNLCVPENIRENVRSVFYQIISGDLAAVEFYENELLTKSGAKVTLSFHNAIIRDEHGTIQGILSSGEDVTDQRRLEEQFYQTQKMEAIGTLVGGIAHDFNNMLAGITGNIYLAKLEAIDMPAIENRLTSVETLSYRAADMIQQLLTFARKGDVVMKPLQLDSFIRETLKFLRSAIPENIQLNVQSDGESMLINGDATQLHQVLMNLINNARDALAGARSPAINIKLETREIDAEFLKTHPHEIKGSYAHLMVEDNGCGIPDEWLPHLFEPFFTTKEEGKGTGLGLAMVFGAITTHKGFIEVTSTPNEGSCFHLYLPLQESASNDAPGAAGKTPSGHGEKILVVDDHADVRQSSRDILESLNYSVLEAYDGEDAVEIFRQYQSEINLILIDVVMPKLGGVEAIRQIRKIRPQIKVIYSTGYDKEEALKGEPLGNDIVLSKPYNVQELSRSIQKQLNL